MIVCLLLVISVVENLHTWQVDFVLAFPQASLDVEIYMLLPQGFDADGRDFVLLLQKNLYGLKQASMTWFEKLRDGLVACGFCQSIVDPCCFHQAHLVLLVFLDDCLLFSWHVATVDKLLISLRLEFVLTDEGNVSDYLGIRMIKHSDGRIELTQPALIQQIIDLLGIRSGSKVHFSPVIHKGLLHKDVDGPVRKQTWNYRSAIGMLNYLAASTRPDIAFVTHQCARFCNTPKLSHEQAVKRIACYLLHTPTNSIIYTPDHAKSVHCYVDADFAGLWNYGDAQDPVPVMSCTGYTIHYAGCLLVWLSKLQTEVALSTTEAEYIALSQSLRDIIPLLNLLKELQVIFPFITKQPVISCTLFKDNAGALQLATTHKTCPHTKHLSLKSHHFRSHVSSGLILILPINTFEQLADIFTKPLPEATFKYLCFKLLGS